ncbi:hypothetical protein ASE74_19815 [Pedobacter sp. Leaf216]|uniref:ligand-binding sensor domain-containing protein n=1 Tax=Pedobacter sp. Leaf216 TaxID=1735684 RepID=UPI0006F34845|nr:two-component regulator propeller domain-containing protein [Pedobacter sp. Leaf216]KQM76299.1 hypothetical protein ASE74_19815 [Pedobacter sp. Leaf216]
MFRKLHIILSAVLFLIVIPNLFLHAQIPAVKFIDVNSGIPNNDVTTIYQDNRGLMWIGTYDGLTRYDGYHFIVYRNNLSNPNSLINNRINCITQDHLNQIWIGTRNGISRFNYSINQFSNVNFKSVSGKGIRQLKGNINAIKEDALHHVFIASEVEGLLTYNFVSNKAEQIPLYKHNNLISFSYAASAITLNNQNELWTMVKNVGLCKYNSKNNRLEVSNTLITEASTIVADHLGNIWIATDMGLHQYSLTRQLMLPVMLAQKKINHISLDSQNMLWIASDGNGIFTISPGESIPRKYV